MSKGNVVNVNYIDSALNDLHDKRDSDSDNHIKTPFLTNVDNYEDLRTRTTSGNEFIENGIGNLQEKVDNNNNNTSRVRSSESSRYSNEFYEPLRKHSSLIDPIEAEKWLNPYHNVNIAIFASYLSVGFGLYFLQTPLTFYMVDSLNATPGQQTVINGLMYLPWALKIFCGILTDSFPIFGYRRKSYFLLGWGLYVACNILLAIIRTPNIAQLAALIFLQTLAFVQADVCTDASIVERSKLYENNENRGTLQATGYIIRYFGGIIGAMLGAVLYNKDSWGWGLPISVIFVINGAVPMCLVLPFVYSFVELPATELPQVKKQLYAIWQLVQRRAIWQPCAFIYIYNIFVLTNPAWNSFLVDGLGFSNFFLGLLTVGAAVLSYSALVIYKKYLFNVSWRYIYLGGTALSSLFSILQLILVFRWNVSWGISSPGWNLVFAMGTYGMVQFVQSIQFLPCCRMFLIMCPGGAEGASYAMLTTLSNLAGTVAYSIAAAVANIWNVENDTLLNHDYSGMWRLTVFCACIQLTGLIFLGLIPNGVDEQLALQSNNEKSLIGGTVFLTTVGLSLVFVMVITFITV